mmetsp:Transcript_59653/g.168059  ORF Transcript_59653/g.168059 Transcript_59653/m.168059 type:complete len:216 (-) Transcript_59653:2-649(-)
MISPTPAVPLASHGVVDDWERLFCCFKDADTVSLAKSVASPRPCTDRGVLSPCILFCPASESLQDGMSRGVTSAGNWCPTWKRFARSLRKTHRSSMKSSTCGACLRICCSLKSKCDTGLDSSRITSLAFLVYPFGSTVTAYFLVGTLTCLLDEADNGTLTPGVRSTSNDCTPCGSSLSKTLSSDRPSDAWEKSWCMLPAPRGGDVQISGRRGTRA